MIGRPKHYNEHEAMLAAMKLFWQHGYATTSLDDLLGVMSLSKSNFYSQFESKQALYRACLEHYCQVSVDRLRRTREESASNRDFLNAILREVIHDAISAVPRGCLIVNSAVEFGQHRGEFSEDVRSALEHIQRAFEQAILRGAREGEISSPECAKTLALSLMTFISGLRAMIKGGMSANDASTVARRLVDSMV